MAALTASTDVALTVGEVRVDIEYIGEGWAGDYNPDDPDDAPLLRFSVSRRVDGEWEPVDDASYCTRMEAKALDAADRLRAAERIMGEVYLPVSEGRSIKRICEALSWMEH